MTASPQARGQTARQLSQAINRHMSKPVQQMQDMLADAKKVGVIAHAYSDTNAIGVVSVMVMALVQRGISAVASYDKSDLPVKSLLTAPGWERFVEYTDLDKDIDMRVTVDYVSPGRLGTLEDRMVASDHVINVDHHATNTRFGATNMVDELAESLTMAFLGLLGIWGIKLTTPMAHVLYAGLLTDVMSFQFDRSRMHIAVTRLLDKGLDPRTTGTRLLEKHPFTYLLFLDKVLSTTTLVPKRGDGTGLIHVVIEHNQTAGVGRDEIESAVDTVRTINAVGICTVLEEYELGQWAVSLCSQGPVDVSQIALEIGGGDHERTAGLARGCGKDELLQALLNTSDVATQVRRGTGETQGIVGLVKNQEAH